MFRLLSDFVSSVSDEYSLHWLDKLFCCHSKLVVDWQLPVRMPRCLHTASDLCGSLINVSKQIRMMSAALTVVEHLESLGS